ncbi:uncharacterized protein LOC141629927 [Silene latifolia]|uniref:uncharacterized protein LOC141629927 n=1 Tax=Silene latifolia TaxID=37657 RepID=UPI003D76EFF9
MSDHSGMHIVDTIFNGQNYTSWSRAITLALGSKNKLGFLDGTTTIPAAATLRHQHWLRSDYMIRCWILNSIDSRLKDSFLTCKSAKLLWLEIRERYGQCNGPLLFQLKKELRNITQDNSSVVEYFNKLKRNWDEIDELESFPDCNCGAMSQCTCNLLRQILDNASREKVINFLMGLGSSYEVLRTNILSMEPIPNINKVYSIIHQAESQKQVSGAMVQVPEASALYANKPSAQGNWNVWRRDGKQAQTAEKQPRPAEQPVTDERWCNHCKKGGHTRDSCFILHPEKRARYMARFSKPAHSGDSKKFSANVEVQDTQSSHL